MIKKVIILSFVLLFGCWVNNTQAATYDLKLESGDISFSESVLIAGSTVRVYARIYNTGTEDIAGYVTFYRGAAIVDDSQTVSVRPGNFADAWVDFQVPNTAFNVLARIQGTQPADQNTSNNEALTGLVTPDFDTDGDGIANSIDPDDDNDSLTDLQEQQLGTNPLDTDSDNDGASDSQDAFPLNSNEQLDTDNDTIGNNADPDDDNDGLVDTEEISLGTNPLLADSDGDGVNDKNDFYPLDGNRSVEVRDIFEPTPELNNNDDSELPSDTDVLQDLQNILDQTQALDDQDEPLQIDAIINSNFNQSKDDSQQGFWQAISQWWLWLIVSIVMVIAIAAYYLYFHWLDKKYLVARPVQEKLVVEKALPAKTIKLQPTVTPLDLRQGRSNKRSHKMDL